MTTIRIYDDTEKELEKIAERMDTSIAEVIDMLMDFASELD